MNRRDFLKAAGATGVLASLNVLTHAQTRLPARIIPIDKGVTPEMLAAWRLRGARRSYRGAQRFALGMPCGGIGAGQLYVLGDGSLGGWHIDGRLNATGYGADCYKIRPQPRELQQGFKIVIDNGDKPAIAARLADVEHGGDFDNIEFFGEYPIAELRYGSPRTSDFPLDVTLRAGSPFIPLNAKDSALPCTILRFKLENKGDRSISGRLAGWLENGIDKAEKGEIPAQRRNVAGETDGLAYVMMDALAAADTPNPRSERMLFDFEQPDYTGWQIKGEAFGQAPAKGKTPHQNPVSGFDGAGLVNSYAEDDNLIGELLSPEFQIDRHYMTLLVGGGGHAGRTSVNLLIDGKIARAATGKNDEKLDLRAWDLRDLAGKTGRIQIVDAQRGPWGHINVDSIKLVDVIPAAAKRHQSDSLSYGTLALAGLGTAMAEVSDADTLGIANVTANGDRQVIREESPPPVGGLIAPFSLKPGESCEIPFIVAWYFPNLHTGNGVMYANWFADASEVAAYVWKNFKRLTSETDLFRKTWYDDTTLPRWLAARLFMPTANLATGTAQWWKNGRFWGWEGVGCCSGTCTHVWNYAHAEARLFPQLARSTRVMQDLDSGFEESSGRVAFRGEVKGGFEYAADGQSGTVLKCYREHLCSSDDSFLRSNWPRIKKVLEYQIERDALTRAGKPGEPDGTIEVTQHNTYDINFEGPNTFVGSLYIAALLAGAAMADRVGESDSAQRYREIAKHGREFAEQNLFVDGYFVQRIPSDAATRFQYGEGCLADQLFGQNWSRCLGLGTVYAEKQVASALHSVYRHNWTPVIGQYNAQYPPDRWFAQGREGGMLVCTWPRGGRPDEPVLYRDEVWTGCEYQVAGGMVWEGLLDEALVIVKAIDDRYDGSAHNPWNEVECGDHYARAMASYGVFQAICGFSYDGPAGEIGIAPRLNADNFAAFFSAAEGWGLVSQERSADRWIVRFELRWGSLRVSRIALELPAPFAGGKVTVTVAGKQVEAAIIRAAANAPAFVQLQSPTVVNAADSIEVLVSA